MYSLVVLANWLIGCIMFDIINRFLVGKLSVRFDKKIITNV